MPNLMHSTALPLTCVTSWWHHRRKYRFVLLLLLTVACAPPPGLAQVPAQLKVEYQTLPLGIDAATPRFSWELTNETLGMQQTKYQILVASSEKNLRANNGDVWNSGPVESSQSINVSYGGEPLQPTSRYFWKVKSWDQPEDASAYSEAAWFETGLLRPDAWSAQWIGDGREAPAREEDFYQDIPNPIFRKTFQINKNIQKARLYVSGLGYYEASINGAKAGDHVLDPGWTSYAKRVLYSTYDVTDQLQEGGNAIGMTLGNGWYNPLPLALFGRFNLRDVLTTGQPKLIAELHVWYQDSTKDVIVSDQSWKSSTGPLLRNNIFLGEKYDARREQPGWQQPDFEDSSWHSAQLMKPPGGALVAQAVPPIRITQEIAPVALTEPTPGVYVYDLGQNLAGWVRLRLQGPAGTEVTLRYGELLYDSGRVNGMTTVAGHIKAQWDMRGGPGAPSTAYQEDTYIMKGDGEEVFQQQFGFHGFRYVEVTGAADLTEADLTGLRLNADLEKVGAFACSNPLLNEIQRITEWTMLSNVFSIQSDCPGREKFGYGGDMVAAGEAYIHNFDMATFYEKAVRDFQDDVRPNGGLPETAPYNGIDTEGFGQGSGPVGWQLAHPFLIRQLYRYYGDRRIVAEQYPTAVRMLEFLQTQAKDHYIERGIGDHVSLSYKAIPLTSTAFYYHIAQLVADFAEILGKEKDHQKYANLAAQIKEAFMRRFYHADTGVLDTAVTQANQVFGLYYGLVPEKNEEKVLEVLVDDILQTQQGHVSTGIFATKMLWNVLDQYDRNDVAYTLASQTDFPGYGHMLAQGATTLWETWEEPDQNSWNHPMFGSVSEWFYASLLGIQQAADGVGFDKITIKPSPVGDLTWAKGHYHSVRGKITVDWKKEQGQWICRTEIPGNTTATLALPVGEYKNPEIRINGQEVLKDGQTAPGSASVKFLRQDAKRVYVQVEPGTYEVVIK